MNKRSFNQLGRVGGGSTCQVLCKSRHIYMCMMHAQQGGCKLHNVQRFYRGWPNNHDLIFLLEGPCLADGAARCCLLLFAGASAAGVLGVEAGAGLEASMRN